MDYHEAKQLGQSWTTGHDVNLGGWRSVITVLLQRITILETTNKNLHDHCQRLSRENEALSLDLGIKDQDFRLPPQPQLQTIADIIRECEKKPSTGTKDNSSTEAW